MKRLASITVFGLASCLVYIISTIEGVPAASLLEPVPWRVLASGSIVNIELPFLWLGVVVAHTLFALKVYAQAWGMDQSVVLIELAESASKWQDRVILVGEWLLRSLWVFMVSYLPNAFSKSIEGQDLTLGLSLGDYYVALIGIVVFWDAMMFKKIVGASSQISYVKRSGKSKREVAWELAVFWLSIDVVLFLIAVTLKFIEVRFFGDLSMASLVVGLFLMGCTLPLCGVQLAFWGREVVRSKVVSSGSEA